MLLQKGKSVAEFLGRVKSPTSSTDEVYDFSFISLTGHSKFPLVTHTWPRPDKVSWPSGVLCDSAIDRAVLQCFFEGFLSHPLMQINTVYF